MGAAQGRADFTERPPRGEGRRPLARLGSSCAFAAQRIATIEGEASLPLACLGGGEDAGARLRRARSGARRAGDRAGHLSPRAPPLSPGNREAARGVWAAMHPRGTWLRTLAGGAGASALVRLILDLAPPGADEPLVLRTLRKCAEHPVRTALSLGLILWACAPAEPDPPPPSAVRPAPGSGQEPPPEG